jgi:hypothetical protein
MLLIVVIVLILIGTIAFTAYQTSYRPKVEPHVGNFVPSSPEPSKGSPSVRPPRPTPAKPRMPIRTGFRTSNRPRHTIPNDMDDDELYAPGVAALDRMRSPPEPEHSTDLGGHSHDSSPSHDHTSHDSSHSHDSSSHDSGGGFDGGSHGGHD